MGRIVTPAYRVELTVDRGYWTPQVWRTTSVNRIPSYGRPTSANLAKFVRHMETATRPGGFNAHIGETRILSARIIRQETGETVATYTAPLAGL